MEAELMQRDDESGERMESAVRRRFRDATGLIDHGRSALRADALSIAAAGLAAVDPAAALRRTIRVAGDTLFVRGRPWHGLEAPPAVEGAAELRPEASQETAVELGRRRLFLVGAGKASIGMAAVLDELLGPRFTDAAVVVKRGQAAALPRPLRYVDVLEAAHPVPDDSSLAGGRRLLDVARQARPGDLVLAIVTGGSSSLAVTPAEGITLQDKIETNRLLLACGADIVAINNVRKHISAIKGGLLAQVFGASAADPGACRILNFTVSDVVGDPLDYVTDLTVPDRSTWAMARETCDRFDLWDALPPAVAERLRRADPRQETPKELASVLTWVVADAAQMCAAAGERARALGYRPRLLGLDWEGEARAAGAALARELRAAPPGSCLLAGGENTVTLATSTVRHTEGGPSQEAALAAALELAGSAPAPDPARATHPAGALPARAAPAGAPPFRTGPAGASGEWPAVVLCLDSDGTDGPTEAAGGLVDDLTGGDAERAARIADGLVTHRAQTSLSLLGDLVVTGPTGTNVNDLKIALSEPAASGRPQRTAWHQAVSGS